ncbi:peptide ABC transporter permease [Cellulomonas chitinilytica]|uniref:Peptide ABC transporter permease n=1 Tax=Cellulomonas chitinilytica TaxID=398759 RepID=A0A919P3T1_9CELL|nr:ABC transporter permease [Cellulomonas chitinilytica]GIG21735.1 peptide ABC transporter permease [Cellulomonas chitinilytica]
MPWGVVAASAVLVLVLLVVAFPGLFTSRGPLEADPLQAFLPPGQGGLLGTDQLGRSVWSRVAYGARYSIFIAVAATVVGVLVGVAIGLAAGLGGRVTDEVTTRGLDVVAAFPAILLAIVLVTIVGPGIPTVIVALGIASVPRYARIVRAETHVVRRSGYVEQSVTFGLRRSTLVVRHVLPHAVVSVPILATIGLGTCILAASSLSFIGLGPKPPSPEWGAMLSDGRNYLQLAWWISVFPGVAIVAVVVAVSVVGRRLQRHFEHREQS